MWRKLEDDPSLLASGESGLGNNKCPMTSQGNGMAGKDIHGGYPSANILHNKSAQSGMMGHRKLNSTSSSAMIQDNVLSKSQSNHHSGHMSNGRPNVPMKNGYYPSASNSHTNASNSNSRVSEINRRPNNMREKSYRELEDQERYPGLDKETARLVLHSSNLNLSQQHIYSEPNFEHCPSAHQQSNQPAKAKKPFYAFWK